MENEVRVKSFSEVIAGQEVNFYILCMKQSFMLWVGLDTTFRALSVAMNSRFEADPICTQLLGDTANSQSTNLSKRLAKKTGCQCYVSLNIKDPSLCQLVEKHINTLYEKEPHSFFFQ